MNYPIPPYFLDKCTRPISSYWRIAVVVLGGVLAAASSYAGNLSGSYLGKGERFIAFLQLVQTNDGKVVGRLRQSLLRPNGEVQSFDAPLSGAASGAQFVGKLERSSVLGRDTAISGQLLGNRLLLQGPGEQRIHLQRGQEVDYQKSVAAMQNDAFALRQGVAALEKRKQAEQVLRNAAERIDRLTARVAEFVANAPRTVGQLSSIAQKYEAVSGQMEALVGTLRSTPGHSSEAVSKRSALGANALHASIDAEHARINVEHARGDFEREASHLALAMADATKACAEIVPASIDADAFHRACARVPGSARTKDQVQQDVLKAYAELEDSWRKERPRHEALLREAQALWQP